MKNIKEVLSEVMKVIEGKDKIIIKVKVKSSFDDSIRTDSYETRYDTPSAAKNDALRRIKKWKVDKSAVYLSLGVGTNAKTYNLDGEEISKKDIENIKPSEYK